MAVPLEALRAAIGRATPESPEEAEGAGPNRADWIGLCGMWGLDPATVRAAQRLIEASEEFQLAADCPSGAWSPADYDQWWSERSESVLAPTTLRALSTMLLGYWYARKRAKFQSVFGHRLAALQVAPPVADALRCCAAWLEALEATREVLGLAFDTHTAVRASAAPPPPGPG